MRSFNDECWHPTGARWVAQIQLGNTAAALGDAYLDSARRWWVDSGPSSQITDVLEPIERRWRHITLDLADFPAAQVTADQLGRLRAALSRNIAQFNPIELRYGPAVVNTVAIELYIEPHAALTAREAVNEAYRQVFDKESKTQHTTRKVWRAHTALAYCRKDFDDHGLQSALLRTPGTQAGFRGTVTETVTHVLLAATDPWSPSGMTWNTATQSSFPLGTRSVK